MTDLFNLEGKAALVTGGGSGLGQAIAVGLASAGASVAVSGRDILKLRETVNLITKNGGSAAAIEMDILDTDSVNDAVSRVVEEFGHIDILVNSAGVHLKKDTLEVTDEEWSRVIDTNLTGSFRVCRAVATQMKVQGGGKIVNIASLGSFVALKGRGRLHIVKGRRGAPYQEPRCRARAFQYTGQRHSPGSFQDSVKFEGAWLARGLRGFSPIRR